MRIHRIDTEIPSDTADGGFALPVERPFEAEVKKSGPFADAKEPIIKNGARFLMADWGSVGVYTEDEEAVISFTRAFPNTNLMAPLTVIPYVKRTYEPGTYLLINAFYGAASATVRDLPGWLDKYAKCY